MFSRPMIKHYERSFHDQIVPLDGHVYIECTFRSCRFAYAGGEYEFRECEVDGACSWAHTKPAGLTTRSARAPQRKGMFYAVEQVVALLSGELE